MELVSAIDIALDKNFAFAAYRLPDDDQFYFIMQNGDDLAQPQSGCFAIHPFAASDKCPEVYIRPDHFCSQKAFPHSETISDKLLLHSGYSRPIEKAPQNTDKKTHLERVKKALKSIESGELKKTVVARKERLDRGNTSMTLLAKELAKQYPSAFICIFNHPKISAWICATPETLVKQQDDRFETMSLAGTQPVDAPESDWTDKERTEQQIVTDDISERLTNAKVTDLNISKPESVRAGNVSHLKSQITFKSEKSAIELAKLLHPTPAVNGLPSEKSLEFISKTENGERKYYSGFLGPVGLGQQTQLFVNLRCMEIYDEHFVLHIGGGITKDSQPEAEWEETQHKAKTLKSVIEKLRT